MLSKILIANKTDSIEDDNKPIIEFVKSKTRKLFKYQKLAKLRKKLSKNGNSFKFHTKKAGLSFLTLNTRIAFNYLWLVFTKTSISNILI